MKSPFSRERFVGYVSSVSPSNAVVTFPNPKLLERFYFDGDLLQGGLVGNYVIIEGHGFGTLAKTIAVDLSNKTTAYKSTEAIKHSTSHPEAKVEFQLSFDSFSLENNGAGVEEYPEIGSKVFACPSVLLSKLIGDFGSSDTDDDDEPDDLLNLASIDSDSSKPIKISANALLSRHCAIVGTTGSGKSYTLGKIIEEMCLKDETKIVLLDATGEFSDYDEESYCKRLSFGDDGDTYLPYQHLTESDLFALFRPAGQTQDPILQQAIRSLKIAKADPESEIVSGGLIKKEGLEKAKYAEVYDENIETVESVYADFDINKLVQQIELECVYDSGNYGKDPSIWGGRQEATVSYCSSLMKRINNLRVKDDISALFGFKDSHVSGYKKLFDEFQKFYKSENEKLLVVDLSKISSEANVRDIFSNAVGRHFLEGIRKQASPFDSFKEKPLTLVIDEAHQIFEIVRVKDEFSNEYKLDAFEKLAKESRKFGLFLCFSTQRPADIPSGVLSQMGAFIAHRLINDRDIQAIKNSVQDSSAGILSFLPTFKRGQALLTGNEFPMPIIIQTSKIIGRAPKSSTPVLYKKK